VVDMSHSEHIIKKKKHVSYLNKKDESGTQRYIRYIISQKYSFLSIST